MIATDPVTSEKRFRSIKYREDDFGGLTHKVVDTDPEIVADYPECAVLDDALSKEDADEFATALNSLDAKGQKL